MEDRQISGAGGKQTEDGDMRQVFCVEQCHILVKKNTRNWRGTEHKNIADGLIIFVFSNPFSCDGDNFLVFLCKKTDKNAISALAMRLIGEYGGTKAKKAPKYVGIFCL